MKKVVILFTILFMFIILVSAQEKGEGGEPAPVLCNASDGGGGGIISNETIKYDSEILEELNKTSEVRVIVKLKDNSNITVIGTKEERRALLKQIDEWFKPVIDEVLTNISEDEFKLIKKSSNGFSGYITEEGFDKLIKDEKVKSIYLDKIGSAVLDDTIPLINADDVWNSYYTGDGIKVCVIDSGVNASHPDLTGKVINEYCYCDITNLGSGGCCPDTTDEDDNAEDDQGHGTHVVGIIASQDSTYKGVDNNDAWGCTAGVCT